MSSGSSTASSAAPARLADRRGAWSPAMDVDRDPGERDRAQRPICPGIERGRRLDRGRGRRSYGLAASAGTSAATPTRRPATAASSAASAASPAPCACRAARIPEQVTASFDRGVLEVRIRRSPRRRKAAHRSADRSPAPSEPEGDRGGGSEKTRPRPARLNERLRERPGIVPGLCSLDARPAPIPCGDALRPEPPRFEIDARDGDARAGSLHTPHGDGRDAGLRAAGDARLGQGPAPRRGRGARLLRWCSATPTT